MKIIFKVLVFVLAVILLGALAIFFAPGKNAPVVEAPEQMKDDSGDAAADEIYCNQYDPQDCPWNCVVCPPCEVCSSIQCRAKASCAAMGFDENWYKENVAPVEKPAPDGGGQAPNAGMANPASVYCIDQGGKLEIREGDGGQYGVCVMPDATECDEWEFFRTQKCGVDGTNNVGAAPDDQVCDRENCHGLEIVCGPNPAEICTMEYRLGDKCLRHVNCGIVDGVCQQISNAAFDACKACVQKCETDFADDPQKSFDCESNCE